VDDCDAVFGPGDEPGLCKRGYRPDPDWRIPFSELIFIIDSEYLSAFDVEPIEGLIAFDPHRSFAKDGVDVCDALDGQFGLHRNASPKRKLYPP
jgi:hypothetical protein